MVHIYTTAVLLAFCFYKHKKNFKSPMKKILYNSFHQIKCGVYMKWELKSHTTITLKRTLKIKESNCIFALLNHQTIHLSPYQNSPWAPWLIPFAFSKKKNPFCLYLYSSFCNVLQTGIMLTKLPLSFGNFNLIEELFHYHKFPKLFSEILC